MFIALIYIFLVGGLLGVLRDGIKGENFRIDRFPFYGKKYFMRILVFWIFMGITFVVAVTAFFLILFPLVMGVLRPLVLFVVLAILLGLSVIYLSVFWSFSPVIIVSEEVGVNEAFKITLKFFKAHLFRVVLLAVVVMLIRFSYLAVPWSMERLTLVFSGIVGVVGSAVYGFLNVAANASLMVFYIVGIEEKNVLANDSFQSVKNLGLFNNKN